MRNSKKPKWVEYDKKWHNDLFDWFCGLGLNVFVFVVSEIWFKYVWKKNNNKWPISDFL